MKAPSTCQIRVCCGDLVKKDSNRLQCQQAQHHSAWLVESDGITKWEFSTPGIKFLKGALVTQVPAASKAGPEDVRTLVVADPTLADLHGDPVPEQPVPVDDVQKDGEKETASMSSKFKRFQRLPSQLLHRQPDEMVKAPAKKRTRPDEEQPETPPDSRHGGKVTMTSLAHGRKVGILPGETSRWCPEKKEFEAWLRRLGQDDDQMEKEGEEDKPARKWCKKDREEEKSKAAKEAKSKLTEVLQARKAAAPELSALKMPRGKKGDSKKKRKGGSETQRKARRSEDSSSDSSTSLSSSSSGGSIFRLAALPRSGKAADTGKLDFEALQRAPEPKRGGGIGRISLGSSSCGSSLSNPDLSGEVSRSNGSLRNLRKLTDTCIDGRPDGIQRHAASMDITPQRMKALELIVSQGNWTQRAWFRQELKAAQQEAKAESQLQQDQWARRRRPWEGSAGGPTPK
eukprot:s225_g27.t1